MLAKRVFLVQLSKCQKHWEEGGLIKIRKYIYKIVGNVQSALKLMQLLI